MSIKTSTFGRLELSGKEASEFIKQMNDDKPNPGAVAALQRGRKLLQQVLPAISGSTGNSSSGNNNSNK
ncbi:MAG: hypothetical protein RL748_4049 [Pseudomonadota bacterium]|jgi:hypothetical protein